MIADYAANPSKLLTVLSHDLTTEDATATAIAAAAVVVIVIVTAVAVVVAVEERRVPANIRHHLHVPGPDHYRL